MDKIAAPVGKLLFVDRPVRTDKEPLFPRHESVFQNHLVQLINGQLGTFHNVDITESRRRALFHKQGVEHEGVFPVIVKPPLLIQGVVL